MERWNRTQNFKTNLTIDGLKSSVLLINWLAEILGFFYF